MDIREIGRCIYDCDSPFNSRLGTLVTDHDQLHPSEGGLQSSYPVLGYLCIYCIT